MNPQAPRPDPAPAPPEEVRAWLSALSDGEADPQAAEGACAAWRDGPQARAAWHEYHLIGDVLRSSELASPGARDALFLSSLRARLAAEPVVLAPAPLVLPAEPRKPGPQAQATVSRRFGWRAPTAAAAGFAAVVGVLLVTRLGLPPVPGGTPLQVRAPGAAEVFLTGGAPSANLPGVSTGVIRDPRLDAYLSAHQAARVRGWGGLAAVPGGAMRQVEGEMVVSAER